MGLTHMAGHKRTKVAVATTPHSTYPISSDRQGEPVCPVSGGVLRRARRRRKPSMPIKMAPTGTRKAAGVLVNQASPMITPETIRSLFLRPP